MNIPHLIETYRYFGLFVLLGLEYFIIIVPGETELTTAGALSHSPGLHLHVLPIIIATSLGTFAGAMVAYAIGRLLGRPFVVKYGRYVLLTQKRLEQSERLFARYTIVTLVVSRYIAFVRDIIPYVAGINRVRLRIFVPVILISSFLWTTSFVLLGGVIVSAWQTVTTHSGPAAVIAVLVIAASASAWWWVHRKLKRWASAANQATTSTDSEHTPNL